MATTIVVLVAAVAALVVLIAVAFLAARARHVRDRPPSARRCALSEYPFCTGDLVLTSNRQGRRRGAQGSMLDWSVPIKILTGSPYNHAAVAYVDPDTRQVLFWEINGTGTRLATVRDLTDGRQHHDVFVRKLSAPIEDGLFERAMALQWEHEFNFFAPAAVAARALGGHRRRVHPRASLIDRRLLWASDSAGTTTQAPRGQRTCAHMVAELYHLVGVLDYDGGTRGVDPASVSAGDLARRTIDADVLPLAEGYAFGPVVRLDW